MTTLQQIATAESYESVERMLHKLCNCWIRKYGGDYDEVLSNVHLGYAKAYNTFDHSKGKQFTTWVWANVIQQLRYEKRKCKDCGKFNCKEKHQKLFQLQGDYGEYLDLNGEKTTWWLTEFLDGLTADAKTVCQLVIESPKELLDLVRPHSSGIGAIRQHLQEKESWSKPRCDLALREVREALN